MQLKTIVFKNRIRLKDFFIDFDKVSLHFKQRLCNHLSTEIEIAHPSPKDKHASVRSALTSISGLQLRTGWIWENQFLAQLNGPALGGRMKQDQLQT